MDFGFAQKFLKIVDKKVIHIDEEDVENIHVNILNASLNIMNFKTPSRRDDLIMLCYLI